MARIAVVRIEDNVCVSICIADVNDPPYEGTFLVDIDNMACNIGWIYDPVIGDFTDLNPPPPDDGGV